MTLLSQASFASSHSRVISRCKCQLSQPCFLKLLVPDVTALFSRASSVSSHSPVISRVECQLSQALLSHASSVSCHSPVISRFECQMWQPCYITRRVSAVIAVLSDISLPGNSLSDPSTETFMHCLMMERTASASGN